jgi:hypothetical protein
MLALSDTQLETVTNFLRPLRSEKERAAFLKLLGEQLKVRDIDVVSACEKAVRAVGTDNAGSQS